LYVKKRAKKEREGQGRCCGVVVVLLFNSQEMAESEMLMPKERKETRIELLWMCENATFNICRNDDDGKKRKLR
jgi:hypothetical protein